VQNDLDAPLTFEANATLFNLNHILQNENGMQRLNIKKFIDVCAIQGILTGKPFQY
jgi:hypothetical protein